MASNYLADSNWITHITIQCCIKIRHLGKGVPDNRHFGQCFYCQCHWFCEFLKSSVKFCTTNEGRQFTSSTVCSWQLIIDVCLRGNFSASSFENDNYDDVYLCVFVHVIWILLVGMVDFYLSSTFVIENHS